MMKNIILAFSFSFLTTVGFSQNKRIDSLKHELAIVRHDTSRVNLMVALCYANQKYPEIAQIYGEDAVKLAKKIHFESGEIQALFALATRFRISGDNPKSLQLHFHVLQMESVEKSPNLTAQTLSGIATNYADLKDYSKAKSYYLKALEIIKRANAGNSVNLIVSIASMYRFLNQNDSTLFYLQQIDSTSKNPQDEVRYLRETAYFQFEQGNHSQALTTARKGLANSQKVNLLRVTQLSFVISGFFMKLNEPDSAIYYAKVSLEAAQKIKYITSVIDASDLLYRLYDLKDIKLAHAYLKIKDEAVNELYGANKVIDLQKTIADEQERQRNIETQKIARENRLKLYALLAGFGVMLLIGLILYRNNRQKHKANIVLENTLSKLKSTQAQLIQSEKLASLGELTAGIAHEIQNPLNFVNNFSEVSSELVAELEEEQQKPDRDTELEAELLGDLKQNLQKITQHGHRASIIVKGMLEHSRASTGVKEPTDINKLADEYLRLSYHGLRAKDSRFNVELKTDFAQSLPPVSVVSQDIGRVLLNLFNNGFYATQQRAKLNQPGYQPTVTVSTRFLESDLLNSPERATSIARPNGLGTNGTGGTGNGIIEIRVRDNGTGMPESVLEKIFQPFFTTKPTGEGTGLGLSLAYDIVTKGHGGTLEVSSAEGEGTEFVVALPF